jgi:hypothetical protein
MRHIGIFLRRVKNFSLRIFLRFYQPIVIIHSKSYHKKSIANARELLKSRKKIRVGFFVVFSSVFPGRALFEKMLDDDLFQPFIVIIPDTARGHENMLQTISKSYADLKQRYEKVYNAYDEKSNTFIDFSDKLDFVCFANTYENMTHKFYTARYFAKKNIFSFFIPYCYSGRTHYERHVFGNVFYNTINTIFAESRHSKGEIIKINKKIEHKLIMTGYPKMDDIALVENVARDRKKIILAPHHTITEWKNGLNLSNFLQYHDLFLELPQLYPDIDFVFRPHPILRYNLNNLWGLQKTDQYFSRLQSYKNMIYDTSSDYFDLFVNSDGMIHDCGSFLAEYFYTDNPQCYLLKNNDIIDQEFTDFGKAMLENAYKAFSRQEIINFIDEIVIKRNDKMRDARTKFANENIKINHPNANNATLEALKSL